jgi:hypothetical protein
MKTIDVPEIPMIKLSCYVCDRHAGFLAFNDKSIGDVLADMFTRLNVMFLCSDEDPYEFGKSLCVIDHGETKRPKDVKVMTLACGGSIGGGCGKPIGGLLFPNERSILDTFHLFTKDHMGIQCSKCVISYRSIS